MAEFEQNGTIGKLYIVATPIGNSKDMSPRACKVLEEVDIIACEDTRRSMVLLNLLGIHNRLTPNHKFNEHGKANVLIGELLSGKSVAVISDAGTPCISDPGNELIKAAIDAGIQVIGIPGCCAAVTALSVSGFDLSRFDFFGFFPRENADRKKLFASMRRNPEVRTYAFYESPRRVMSAIDFLLENQVLCRVCLANDLTKVHETCFRGTPAEVKAQLLNKGEYEKGEFVLLLELAEEYLITEKQHSATAESMLVEKMVVHGVSLKEAVDLVLQDEINQYSKNELKKAGLNLKKLFE